VFEDIQAVVLAGGQGTRLKPYTTVLPKPLVPLGDMPILEIVLRQLRRSGIKRITIAVNHLAHLIEAFFGDGSRFGLEISYSCEDMPAGTAGPLRLVRGLCDDFLVMNGDLLTTLDYADLIRTHRSNGAVATVSTFKKEVKIDLGVLEVVGDQFRNYTEKPTYNFTVSMGIYALNHRVIDYIPEGAKFDMPDLILALHNAGEKIVCYSGDYDWLDIGRVDDYEQAVAIFEERRGAYLK
jgi:NDP-sugar pyrophosphorylase family protein